jgi:hypothetical protein
LFGTPPPVLFDTGKGVIVAEPDWAGRNGSCSHIMEFERTGAELKLIAVKEVPCPSSLWPLHPDAFNPEVREMLLYWQPDPPFTARLFSYRLDSEEMAEVEPVLEHRVFLRCPLLPSGRYQSGS